MAIQGEKAVQTDMILLLINKKTNSPVLVVLIKIGLTVITVLVVLSVLGFLGTGVDSQKYGLRVLSCASLEVLVIQDDTACGTDSVNFL
ncbi:hypothetical protein IW261DRAFT_1558919 [Armillaria novae-zelandiae]|uniref:Uncharacterized protein n=1 Tax=Armillaria novae-zelandiae TaxID=153914 RepID=A0AA39PP96_9AGAR|nr:hypothetical protein IW261DRAFT_1558919 [Armillaria novae-zelandiae]